jgi:hypothetical protein
MEEGVGHRRGKRALSFEDIVDVRLGDPGEAGELAFRQIAAADPLPEVFNEPPLQFLEVHQRTYFWEL